MEGVAFDAGLEVLLGEPLGEVAGFDGAAGEGFVAGCVGVVEVGAWEETHAVAGGPAGDGHTAEGPQVMGARWVVGRVGEVVGDCSGPVEVVAASLVAPGAREVLLVVAERADPSVALHFRGRAFTPDRVRPDVAGRFGGVASSLGGCPGGGGCGSGFRVQSGVGAR